MRSNRVGHGPTFHDQIDPAPQWHVAVMSGRQMIEQLHPKLRHGFVINIDTVAVRKFLQRLPHSHGCVIDRGFSQKVKATAMWAQWWNCEGRTVASSKARTR